MTFTPSPQQSDFFNWVTNGAGSAVLTAVAGAGKTTTLIRALELMKGNVFFGSFNKKIAVDIQSKAPTRFGLDISTIHAAGMKVWRKAASGNIKVNSDKCRDIFRTASERHIEYKKHESVVLRLVSLAKQAAVGVKMSAEPEKSIASKKTWTDIISHFDLEVYDEHTETDYTELIIKLSRKVLEASNSLSRQEIDFDDMIYSPLLENVKFFKYDWVLIDEAQDTNASRREMALRMLKKGGRLVAVGDKHQAIYGFTGADSDALDLIAVATDAKQLPLDITYRCPKAVVAYAQQWVSHIVAADTAPEGLVSKAEIAELIVKAKIGDAVLCRFNAPLIKNVYKFIAAGIPAKVEGREIGQGLKVMAMRWKCKSLSMLLERLDGYSERETVKLEAKEEKVKLAALNDKVECLKVIIARVQRTDPHTSDPSGRVCQEIDAIFVDEGNDKVVLFSSIHKSKGREWFRVIWLVTGPSNYAKKEWEQEQELNLNYVAATRAKHELCLIDIIKEKE